jgi:hypothetical protein
MKNFALFVVLGCWLFCVNVISRKDAEIKRLRLQLEACRSEQVTIEHVGRGPDGREMFEIRTQGEGTTNDQ